MSRHHVFDYEKLDEYEFERLPKGDMFSVSMNPYKGYVFLDVEKHESSTRIAYSILKQVMGCCELLERGGSDDPLRDYIRFSESGELREKLVLAVRCSFGILAGRRRKDVLRAVASSKNVEKAS